MIYITFLKSTIFRLFFPVVIFLLFYPMDGESAVFNVTDEDELRDALSMAESNGEDDIINIGAGTYNTGGATFTYESIEDFSLTIQGAGDGITILDGDNTNKVLEVSTESDSDVFISIIGLTIQNGLYISRPGDTPNPNGAGILAVSQNLTIEGCELINNTVAGAGDGGGLYASAKNIAITRNLFTGNSAASSGGGAYLNGNHLEISDNFFMENFAGTSGGGLNASGESTLILIKNSFIDNNSLEFGGGAIVDSSSLEIIDNNFFGNTTNYHGGGLRVTARKFTMSDNEFYENTSLIESRANPSPFANWPIVTQGGGAYVFVFEFGSIINNVFYGNTSAGNGGGTGLIFSNNPFVDYGDIDIIFTNNTFTFNSAEIDGGGISIYTEQFGGDVIPPTPPPPVMIFINIYNNIIYNNFAGSRGKDIFIRNTPFFERTFDFILALFNNDVANLFSFCEASSTECEPIINEGSNINEDPLFLDAEAGDFGLLPDSPCIDAGDPDAPDVPDTDIYGNPRVPPPDMGAVEFIQMVVDGEGGGGCSMVSTPVTSSLAVFLVVPVLILMRRIIKRNRG